MDRRMDGQPQRSIVCEMKIACARHDVKTTVDRNRYDRKLQFVSQLERATAEQSHVAGEGASAFGEDGERSTADQALARGCHRFGNGATTRLIYEYETGFFAGITHEGEFAQRGFHHPFELTAEETREEKNVERSLVIGHKDVALMALQVFAPFDFDREEEQTNCEPSPYSAGRESKPARQPHGAT